MELYIDNKLADIDQSAQISISLSIASLTKIESGRTGYSKTIRIPMTKRNMKIIGDIDQVHSIEMYNQQYHTARIEVDGFTVIEGSPHMIRCQKREGYTGEYLINIIGASKLWVKQASERMFNEIEIAFAMKLDASSVYSSWIWNRPVRYLPVQRDKFMSEEGNGYLFPPTRLLTLEDYHPFLSAKDLLKAIFAKAGYTINSEFINGEYFRSFYVSGNYPTKDVNIIKSKMDFLAGRLSIVSAIADRFGRVKCDHSTTISSLGNIVETADPQESHDGNTVEGAFNTNNCFQKIGNRVAFVAPTEVIVGFEYDIKYSAAYQILSRTELDTFNNIYLGLDQTHVFKISNKNIDRRDELNPISSYLLIIFSFNVKMTYQLTHEKTIGNITTTVYSAKINARSTEIITSQANRVSNPKLYYSYDGNTFLPYTDDWALYNGYVTEKGVVEVEVKVRSSPERILPSQPKYFDMIYFGGAPSGSLLSLSNRVRLRPIFTPHPGIGSVVSMKDITAHPVRQIDFINALKQMFNLYFYTDNTNKEVYIEPRGAFYNHQTIVDWSDKMDYSHPVTVEELGSDVYQTLTLLYQDGDGTVTRSNEVTHEKFGRWRTSIKNKFAKQGEEIFQNPLFTPSMNQSDTYLDARAATIIQAGDRNRNAEPETESLNFPPKIVRFPGLIELPKDQEWGWPAHDRSYPFVAFHYKGSQNTHQGEDPNPLSSFSSDPNVLEQNGLSLCFEDRDGVAGMHRFYDNNIHLYNNSKRISAHIMLRPVDIEPLITPNRLKRDFRALYKLKIDGEYGLFYLEQVCDFNPSSNGSTLCQFIKYI